MNPSMPSAASQLHLPLSQLGTHCERLLKSINDDHVSHKDKILFEQTLWNEVKKMRATNDKSIFLYLIGYYHTILYQVAKLSAQNDLFQYHVLIRLGDLNRYMERADVAEYYYCNARNLFPYFGHAYNQLGLLVKPVNCFKCCYYYARAARSTEKPLNSIADSNLQMAVSKFNCTLLQHIINDGRTIELDDERFNGSSDEDVADDEGGSHDKLPRTAIEWFYVIVVAIYANNIQAVTKLFLRFLTDNFSTQRSVIVRESVKNIDVYCDQNSYLILASLDILVDWLKLGTQGKSIVAATSAEFLQIKNCLQDILTLSSNDSNCCIKDTKSNPLDLHNFPISRATDTSLDSPLAPLSSSKSPNSNLLDSTYTSASNLSKCSSHTKSLALPHDYVLRGFRPLDSVHQDLFFKMRVRARGTLEDDSLGTEQSDSHLKYIDSEQLISLVTRIRWKMHSFGLWMKSKTRNIALESILSNRNKIHHLST